MELNGHASTATAELIVYACPTGQLADDVQRYFDELSARPTEAQRYPPHCTLTGFFHDHVDAIPTYVAAARDVADDASGNRTDADSDSAQHGTAITVNVVELVTDPEWIGLRILAPDLERLTGDFAKRVADVPTRVDDIRIKDWLHLSLAYRHKPSVHDELATLARSTVDPATPAGWDLRLYQRERGDQWTLHGSWPLLVTADRGTTDTAR